MRASPDFERLLALMKKLPAIDLPAGRKSIGHGSFENGNWWLKFTLDTTHALAWRHVQELGCVLTFRPVEIGQALGVVKEGRRVVAIRRGVREDARLVLKDRHRDAQVHEKLF